MIQTSVPFSHQAGCQLNSTRDVKLCLKITLRAIWVGQKWSPCLIRGQSSHNYSQFAVWVILKQSQWGTSYICLLDEESEWIICCLLFYCTSFYCSFWTLLSFLFISCCFLSFGFPTLTGHILLVPCFCCSNFLKSLCHRFSKLLEKYLRHFGPYTLYCHDSVAQLL